MNPNRLPEQTGVPMKEKIVLPEFVLHLMEKLEAADEAVYLVGGSLRDALLGLVPHDYDLATSAEPRKTVEIFRDFRVIETGLQHGTVTVLSEGESVEITTFRRDGDYLDSRHPAQVSFTSDLVEDLARRDFTVNAMAYHPKAGLVDPFGGRDDLREKQIRAVGNPHRRFEEDALRIMRAFRFSACLGFEIEKETLRGISETKAGLARISAERLASEFLRLLLSSSPFDVLKQMKELGVLPYLTGTYLPSDGLLAKLGSMPAQETARLGLLLAEAEEARASDILHRLKLSKRCVAGSLAVRRIASLQVDSPFAARRLIAEAGARDAAMGVCASVLLGNSPAEAADRVEHNQAPCTLAELAVTGKDLLSLGIEPIRIGEVLHDLLWQVLEEPERNQKEWLMKRASAEIQTERKETVK